MRRAGLRREIALLAIVVAIGGLSFELETFGPASLARSSSALLASASVSIAAAIPPNPENTTASQLAAKEEVLAAREAQLAAQSSAREFDWGFYAFILSLALLVLVSVNFYLDARRVRRVAPQSPFAVDLRS